ncbi:MAG: hypothetical protein LC775_14905, partial [Acidobacteria bacterium]|nr:hypothetical protein [Acidobacteriota bacterium]
GLVHRWWSPSLFGVLAGTPDTYQLVGLRRGTATSLQQVLGQAPPATRALVERRRVVPRPATAR